MRKCKGIYYKTGKTINFTNGIFHGFFQEGEAAKESFIPDFNGEGV